ncbi:MAG: ATP-binding cassette domain-containing protein [Planctomycetes bacterium]|nr:ATP-binding cassette domain-containing protein [Planctomycetota bacterium]
MNENVIAARGLIKRYGTFTAVDGIDFDVHRGECFGFLGPNGAGKTSTMRMIYRAAAVDGGTLMILGWEAADGRHDRAIKARIGVVPQEDNLDQELSVRQNLEVFARFYKLPRPEAARRIDELLKLLRLEEKAHSRAEQLSGGLKRRTQIARGLLGTPEILVLDEPTTGLDPQARHDLWERLNALKRQQATLLLTTHYMDEAERLCDRLVVIDHGKIVAAGSPAELIARHVSPVVVEIELTDGAVPTEAEALKQHARRVEVLSDRLLLYADHGEQLIAQAAHLMPDRRALQRRTTLEDVFLRITGRRLEE